MLDILRGMDLTEHAYASGAMKVAKNETRMKMFQQAKK